eukprot:TRINITY_DN62100_c0_g1_i4.p1 TRINITY_DN62100_c0_g1~~TRINITY_DN62100_c0_g1_i4.p1  ORF type:complete len:113 (-),score=12.48 TRINITY_DN62100_c0_g1_i4:10-348(-)
MDCPPNTTEQLCISGTETLESLGYPEFSVNQSLIILTCFLILARLLGYAFLLINSPIYPVTETHNGDKISLKGMRRASIARASQQIAEPSIEQIGRAVQQECRDRSRMPSSA